MEKHYYRPKTGVLTECMPEGLSRGILKNVLITFEKMEMICARIRCAIGDVISDSGNLRCVAWEMKDTLGVFLLIAGVNELNDQTRSKLGKYENAANLIQELGVTAMKTYSYFKGKHEIINGSGGYKAVLEQIEGLHRYLGMYDIEPGDDNEWYNVIRSFSADGDELARCVIKSPVLASMIANEIGAAGSDYEGLAGYIKKDPQRVRRIMAERFECTLTSLERLELGSAMWMVNFKNLKEEYKECFCVIDEIAKNLKAELESLINQNEGAAKDELEMIYDRIFGEDGAAGLFYGYFNLIGVETGAENDADDEAKAGLEMEAETAAKAGTGIGVATRGSPIRNRPLELLLDGYDTIAKTYESFYRPMMGILNHIKEGNYEPVASGVTTRDERKSGGVNDIA